ncbi:MAG TPA: methionine--tRNA ligase subunit beta [Candidatus Omnitrophota bacterium]|nr:methionine--tRNA ligase subunit beta [Candidatus Omnitrophota bacterium]
MITIEDFKKVELKIARIKEVNDHPNADKLYVLQVEVGETTKQIVAGIKRAYAKEELVGKLIVIVDNLTPALLRGVESQGMLLASQDDLALAVLSPDKQVKTGSIVK